MAEIIIEIKDCSQCPNFKRERVYTEDSFEEGYDWFCGKNENKKIAGFVEWRDKTPIPDWCPIIVKG